MGVSHDSVLPADTIKEGALGLSAGSWQNCRRSSTPTHLRSRVHGYYVCVCMCVISHMLDGPPNVGRNLAPVPGGVELQEQSLAGRVIAVGQEVAMARQ